PHQPHPRHNQRQRPVHKPQPHPHHPQPHQRHHIPAVHLLLLIPLNPHDPPLRIKLNHPATGSNHLSRPLHHRRHVTGIDEQHASNLSPRHLSPHQVFQLRPLRFHFLRPIHQHHLHH